MNDKGSKKPINPKDLYNMPTISEKPKREINNPHKHIIAALRERFTSNFEEISSDKAFSKDTAVVNTAQMNIRKYM